jgi:hypothetical protein
LDDQRAVEPMLRLASAPKLAGVASMPSAERAAEPGTTLTGDEQMLDATMSVSAKAARRERIRPRKSEPR